jgi:DNA-binding response OmpR family regulator
MKILIIEDEAAISNLILKCYCFPSNHLGVVAENLKDAVAAAADGDFDVVVMDLDLPDSAGWATLISVRAKFPFRVPILIVSAELPPGGVARAIELGASEVLLKPWVTATRFAEAIDHAVARSRHPVVDRLRAVVDDARAAAESIKSKSEGMTKITDDAKSRRRVLSFLHLPMLG